MSRVLGALAACVASAMTGCFNPALDGFACGPAGECPDGYECSIDGQCVATGTPPGPDIDAGPPDPNDREAPRASVVFPLAVGATEADSLVVRGTASDTSPIRAVRVNGAAATSANGFQDWTARVPLAPGVNALAVETEDVQGNVDPAATSVSVERISRLLSDPNGMAVTPDGATAMVFDQAAQAIVAIDVATGERRVLSDDDTGAGPSLVDIDQMAVTPDGATLLAVDRFEAALVAIDLGTGDRRVVSGDGAGSGEGFDSLAGVTVSPDGTTAFVGDDVKNVVFAVDLGSGARRVMSGTNAGGTTIGVGTGFDDITALAFDAANNGVLVVDSGLPALFGVELDGDRFVLADNGFGTGPDLLDPIGVAPGPQDNLAYVLDAGLNALVLVNEDNGNRTLISGMGQGSGSRISDLESLAIHPDGARAFVTDDDAVLPVVIDLETGARTPLAAASVGSGTALSDPESVALDAAAERLVVADDALNGLVEIDLATGDRTLIRDMVNGLLGDPQAVAYLPDGQVLVMNSADNQCVSVDLEAGTTTLISSNADTPGPAWDVPEAMTLDATGTAALVADYTPMLVSVDLSTGERVLISDNDSASGIALDEPVSIILDDARSRVLIADTGANALIAVDLATGARSELGGSGADLVRPERIALGAAPDSAVVFDANAGAYVLLDLATGNRSPLFTAELRGGLPLSTPGIMVVDRARNVLLTADFKIAGVIAIDLVTGDRLIVSR
jgi:DNA-binding beta-propeller fold protein YncE